MPICLSFFLFFFFFVSVNKNLFKVRKMMLQSLLLLLSLYWNRSENRIFAEGSQFVIIAKIRLASQQNSSKANQVTLTIFW